MNDETILTNADAGAAGRSTLHGTLVLRDGDIADVQSGRSALRWPPSTWTATT